MRDSEDDYAWSSDKNLTECVKRIWTHPMLSDVTFIVGEEGSKVLANKCILAARSPVFFAMFTGSLAEGEIIRIPDIDEEHFRAVLGYMYTDDIDIDTENVACVTYIAKKYLLDNLYSKCAEYLKQKIYGSLEDAYLGLQLGYIYNDEELYKMCKTRIHSLARDALTLREFTLLYRNCIKDFIRDHSMIVEEKCIFEALVRWAEEECERQQLELNDFNKRYVLGDILDFIQFHMMESDYFANKIANSVLLTKNEITNYHHIWNSERVVLFRRFRRKIMPSDSVCKVTIMTTSHLLLSGILCVIHTYAGSYGAKCEIDILGDNDVILCSTMVTKGILSNDVTLIQRIISHDAKVMEFRLPKCVDIIPKKEFTVRLTCRRFMRFSEGVLEKKKVKFGNACITFKSDEESSGECIAGLLVSNST